MQPDMAVPGAQSLAEGFQLAELHHRVANVFQLVGGLLSVQAARAPDRVSAEALRSADAQLRAFALLVDQLRARGIGRPVCAVRYLRRLAAHLEAACLAPRSIELALDLPIALPLGERVCQTLGLVVVECVMNAVKHAFAGRDRGQILVTLEGTRAGVRCTVGDDGNGFGGAAAGGQGLRLVHMLAADSGGHCRIESCGLGTRVIVLVPDAPGADRDAGEVSRP